MQNNEHRKDAGALVKIMKNLNTLFYVMLHSFEQCWKVFLLSSLSHYRCLLFYLAAFCHHLNWKNGAQKNFFNSRHNSEDKFEHLHSAFAEWMKTAKCMKCIVDFPLHNESFLTCNKQRFFGSQFPLAKMSTWKMKNFEIFAQSFSSINASR